MVLLSWQTVAVSIIMLMLAVLGLLAFFHSKRRQNIYFFLFAATNAVIISSAYFSAFPLEARPDLSLFISRITYFAVPLMGLTLYLFSLRFPKPTTGIAAAPVIKWVVGSVGTALAILAISSPLVAEGIEYQPWGFDIIYGDLYYPLYIPYFLILLCGSVFLLARKFAGATALQKRQLVYFFVGLALFLLAEVVFNVVVPAVAGTQQYYMLGNFGMIFFVGCTTYAVLNRHLFEIRIVAAEIFTTLLIIVLILNLFTADNAGELALELIILITATIFGLALIRSVISGIKTREQIQALADRLEKANAELRRADKAKTEFISMASHQLRTPLTAIKGYISMILEGQYGDISEKAEKALRHVYNSNERLVNLVHDLLTISRVEMGKLEADVRSVQPEELIRSCLEDTKLEAKEAGLKLMFEKPEQTLPKIDIDPTKIRQALLNLIDNAIKYTDEGSITVRADEHKNYVSISVSDTGEGLAKEEQDNIFQSFSRGEAGQRMFTEGTGLGLHVAQRFVELHNGRIRVESDGKGEGSTFIIELPIKQREDTISEQKT